MHLLSVVIPPPPPPPPPSPPSVSVKSQSHISVLYMNACSLLPKRDELLAHIAVEKPDIIAITESWANSSHLMTEFVIEGYENYNKNRQHRKRGRVVCYVRNTLAAIKIEKEETQNYDTVYVELTTTGNKKLMVAIVYRPIKQVRTDDTALYEEIQSTIRNKNTVIVGDFNCRNINWNSMHGDQGGSRLLEMVEDSFLSNRYPTDARKQYSRSSINN